MCKHHNSSPHVRQSRPGGASLSVSDMNSDPGWRRHPTLNYAMQKRFKSVSQMLDFAKICWYRSSRNAPHGLALSSGTVVYVKPAAQSLSSNW